MLARMIDAEPSPIVPRIQTARLLLRELRASDFDAYAENLADPVATEHLSGVVPRSTAFRLFAAATGFWMLHGAGWWGVELPETGQLVGTVGAFFRETSTELEVGWTLYRPFWQKGFATEAARAVVAHAFETHDVPYLIAHISSSNDASINVSRKLGMHYDADVELYGERIGRYVIER